MLSRIIHGSRISLAVVVSSVLLALFVANFVTVLGFNLFGDGLRDALDPRLK